jgi:hypothetical protein
MTRGQIPFGHVALVQLVAVHGAAGASSGARNALINDASTEMKFPDGHSRPDKGKANSLSQERKFK